MAGWGGPVVREHIWENAFSMDPWTKTPLCSSWVSKKVFSCNGLMYTVYSFTLGLHCLPQRQWGALKFRKPHKGNQFLSNYSETVGPILMILSADPYENWMPMKCWKNQSSSISERKRARSYHYVFRPVVTRSSSKCKIPKGNLEAMPKVLQKQIYWTI